MQDTAGEAGTSSLVMYSYGPPHMAGEKQDDQLEHTFSSYVRIQDVSLKTCQRRWTIGRSGDRGSRISVLAARHDDDDDDDDFNCCCCCSFAAEIIKIGQSSHKMYSYNILNFQESTPILNACTKKSGNWMHHVVFPNAGTNVYVLLTSKCICKK